MLFVVGVAAAIWSASGYIGAFMRASNAIYEVEEGRPFYVKRPVQLAVTVVMLVLVAASALAIVVTGGLAKQVGKLVGVGSTAVTVWDIAKWPVLLLIVAFMFSILYWAAPNVKQPGFRWLTPGGFWRCWCGSSRPPLFALYVANFGSYNKTYGTLGGVIAFLVWLWISNLAVLSVRSSTPSSSAGASWSRAVPRTTTSWSSRAWPPRPERGWSLRLDQAAPDRVAGELHPVAHAQLVEDVRPVPLDRLLADHERLGDLAAGVALRDELDDLGLARAERIAHVLARAGARSRKSLISALMAPG